MRGSGLSFKEHCLHPIAAMGGSPSSLGQLDDRSLTAVVIDQPADGGRPPASISVTSPPKPPWAGDVGQIRVEQRRRPGRGKTALIVVDMQNDFISGSLAVAGNSPTAADCVVQINQLRVLHSFDVVVQSQDFHPPNHCSFAASHPGAELFSKRLIPTP